MRDGSGLAHPRVAQRTQTSGATIPTYPWPTQGPPLFLPLLVACCARVPFHYWLRPRGRSSSTCAGSWGDHWMWVRVLKKAGHPSVPVKPGHHGKGHLCFIVQPRPLLEPES